MKFHLLIVLLSPCECVSYINVSVFVSISLCFITITLEYNSKLDDDTSSSSLIFRIVLAILLLHFCFVLYFYMKLKILVSRYVKDCVGILIRLCWINRLFLVRWAVLQCWYYWSAVMGDVSIFWYFLQFPSLMI